MKRLAIRGLVRGGIFAGILSFGPVADATVEAPLPVANTPEEGRPAKEKAKKVSEVLSPIRLPDGIVIRGDDGHLSSETALAA